MTGHEGGQGGGASPGDLKLSGVTLGAKEKVGGDKVENQELGAESLHLTVLISQLALLAVGYKHGCKSCLILFLLLYNIMHHYVSVLSSQNLYYYIDMKLVYL